MILTIFSVEIKLTLWGIRLEYKTLVLLCSLRIEDWKIRCVCNIKFNEATNTDGTWWAKKMRINISGAGLLSILTGNIKWHLIWPNDSFTQSVIVHLGKNILIVGVCFFIVCKTFKNVASSSFLLRIKNRKDALI